MSAMLGELLRFLLIGLVAGWIAAILVRPAGRRSIGLLGYMVTGMLGAVIGGFLFERLGIPGGAGFLGSVLTATVGAVVLLVMIRLIRAP